MGGSFELNLDTLDCLLKRFRAGANRQPFADVEEGRARIAALMRFVNNQMGTMVPVVLAGIFHRQVVFLTLDREGSAKAIYLLTSTLLGKAGLDLFELLCVECYCQLDIARYSKQVLARPVLKPHHKQIIDYEERHGSISQQEYGVISSRGYHLLTLVWCFIQIDDYSVTLSG